MKDWNEIKTKYICSAKTPKALAEEYGVDVRTVQRHIAQGGWRELRSAQAEKLRAKAAEKAAEHGADKLAKLMCAASKAVDVAVDTLEDEQQFKRHLVSENDEVVEKVYGKVDVKALRQLTGSLKDLTALMRDFYNLPTPAQAEQRRLAAERIELEKRRLSADRSGQTLTVRFEDTEGAER